MSKLEIINQEINTEIAKVEVQKALLATTFKGLDLLNMKKALMEGMMRGFSFQDFLEKNVYAIPYSSGYSLVTSVDYARKIGAKSGVVGKSAPVYEEKDGKIISCEVTIKKQVGEHIGDYTAKVYFSEYDTGRNLWKTKPRTMIAKVAEMHALRMACPEELAKAYVEEEVGRESISGPVVTDDIRAKVEGATTEEQLKAVWEKYKGLGKEFSQMVVAQKNFIKSVANEENANS